MNTTFSKRKRRLLHCPVCEIVFWRRNRTTCCSVHCKNILLQKPKILVVCTYCKNNIYLSPSDKYWHEERGFVNHFCNRTCQRSYHKKESHPRWITDRTKVKNEKKSFRETLKKWRTAVFERDNWTCQLCSARSSSRQHVILNAHHIKKLSLYPELADVVNNGITLCEPCHKKTYHKEHLFEQRLSTLINDCKK